MLALPSVRATGRLCIKFDTRDFYKNLSEKIKKLYKIVQQCRAPYMDTHACSYYRKLQNILYLTTFKPVVFDVWLKYTERTHNCFVWPNFVILYPCQWHVAHRHTESSVACPWQEWLCEAPHCYVIRRSMLPAFLGSLPKLIKTAISFVICVCFSFRSHGPSCFPLNGFLLVMIFVYF